MVNKDFWNRKRVFLTGHTGFKGGWLSLWLSSLGAEVKGYALNPLTFPSLFIEAKIDSIIDSQIADILDQETLYKSMITFDPDILIHMAAQPLVRYSYDAPIETYEVNVIGTAKVLEVARSCNNLKVIINVTTDKCYENDGRSKGYKESDPMGGHDPYSSSKGCAELITSAYRRSFLQEQGVGLASVRAGNVIGGGDWSNDRLIPDILRSFERNEAVVIRNPKATRPWQHVLEPLFGYLKLSEKLFRNKKYQGAWNFGPSTKNNLKVIEVANLGKKILKSKSKIVIKKNKFYESTSLSLNSKKSLNLLKWKTMLNAKEALKLSFDWYKFFKNNKLNSKIIKYTFDQIKDYKKIIN
jgi:CDP-glucose 4,6-dehydratase